MPVLNVLAFLGYLLEGVLEMLNGNNNLRLMMGSLVLVLILGLLGDYYYRTEKETKGDFSTFWLASFWMREKPNIPLYHSKENLKRANTKVWTMIGCYKKNILDPWRQWGGASRLQGAKFKSWKIGWLIICYLLQAMPSLPVEWVQKEWHLLLSQRFFGILIFWGGIQGAIFLQWFRREIPFAIARGAE